MAFRITALGVGHGDALLLRWSGTSQKEHWTCIVDGGASPKILQEHLIKLDIESVDLVIGTHPDSDHIGGLLGLAQQIKGIDTYWAPPLPAFERHLWLFGKRGQKAIKRCRDVEDCFERNGTQVLYPVEGYSSSPFGYSGPRIHVLSPAVRLIRDLLTKDDVSSLFTSKVMPIGWCLTDTEEDIDQVQSVVSLDRALATYALKPDDIPGSLRQERVARIDRKNLCRDWSKRTGAEPEFFGDSVLNNTSIVCWLEIPTEHHIHRILLTGDQENWTYLLARHPRGLHADVFKAPHHGGQVFIEQHPSHNEILSHIRPKVVIISANGCHGLPHSSLRESAIRWGSAVICTSERTEETIIGPESKETCCHLAMACDGSTQNIELTLDHLGIRSNRRSCHPGLGALPGPVVEVHQHIVNPSNVLDRLAEHELRRHIEWVRKTLRKIHAARKTKASEMLPGSEPVNDAQLTALAPDKYRSILTSHLPTILSKGQERGAFWAYDGNTRGSRWVSYAKAEDKEIRNYMEHLYKKQMLVFPGAVDLVHRDPDSLVTRLDHCGLAGFADAALHFPVDTYQEVLWPAVVKALKSSDWHCYVNGNDLAFSRHSDQKQLLIGTATAFLDSFDKHHYYFSINIEQFPYSAPVLFSGKKKVRNGECPYEPYECRMFLENRWLPKTSSFSGAHFHFRHFIDLAEKTGETLISTIKWDNREYEYSSLSWDKGKKDLPEDLVAAIETDLPVRFSIKGPNLFKLALHQPDLIDSTWLRDVNIERLW